jgi:hypothetical protein
MNSDQGENIIDNTIKFLYFERSIQDSSVVRRYQTMGTRGMGTGNSFVVVRFSRYTRVLSLYFFLSIVSFSISSGFRVCIVLVLARLWPQPQSLQEVTRAQRRLERLLTLIQVESVFRVD